MEQKHLVQGDSPSGENIAAKKGAHSKGVGMASVLENETHQYDAYLDSKSFEMLTL